MALADLTDLASVKAYAGVTSTATDQVIGQLITGVSAFVRTWTNRDITSNQYTITRSGRGEFAMLLPQYPITSVASVRVDNCLIPTASANGGTGFMFDDVQVALVGYRFNRGMMNCKIVFTAGFDTVPADLALACCELVTLKLRIRDKIEVASKTLAGETVSFTQRDMPASVATVLKQYQRIAPL